MIVSDAKSTKDKEKEKRDPSSQGGKVGRGEGEGEDWVVLNKHTPATPRFSMVGILCPVLPAKTIIRYQLWLS